MTARYGLIFDVDGVIADTESVNALASIKAFEDVIGLHGVRREDFRDGLGRGSAEYVKAAARVHNVALTENQVALLTKARQENFLTRLRDDPLPAFPGVLNLVHAAVSDPEFGVAIATSSTREKSGAVLQSAGVPFEQMPWITGDDISRKKPDPEVFLVAAARLGVVPANCVVIEDAPNGVQAARAGGFKCIAVTNSVPADELAAADHVVATLEEVTLGTVRDLLEGPPSGAHVSVID